MKLKREVDNVLAIYEGEIDEARQEGIEKIILNMGKIGKSAKEIAECTLINESKIK